jgi:hypothetical protein
MPTNIQNQQVLRATSGFLVVRAAAALPSTAIGTIFNINGGRVLIRHLGCIVASTLSGTNSTTIGLTPTFNTTSAPAALSSAGIIPVATGSMCVSKLDGGALIVVVNGSIIAPTPWAAPAGALTITTASTVTGTVSWEIVYAPLDPAASVTAA